MCRVDYACVSLPRYVVFILFEQSINDSLKAISLFLTLSRSLAIDSLAKLSFTGSKRPDQVLIMHDTQTWFLILHSLRKHSSLSY